jgi:very-short-patch-repair endonuclease
MSNIFARELRKSMTDAERKLWRGLRMRQLHGHKFRRQFPIGAYIVDFVCLDARLIIEVDGGQHADDEYGDADRDTWLRLQNFRVLRYWNNQVLNELDAVLQDIARSLGDVSSLSPHPPIPPSQPSQPSPARGGRSRNSQLERLPSRRRGCCEPSAFTLLPP